MTILQQKSMFLFCFTIVNGSSLRLQFYLSSNTWNLISEDINKKQKKKKPTTELIANEHTHTPPSSNHYINPPPPPLLLYCAKCHLLAMLSPPLHLQRKKRKACQTIPLSISNEDNGITHYRFLTWSFKIQQQNFSIIKYIIN